MADAVITAVDFAVVDMRGGTLITATGTFTKGVIYHVFMGLLGTVNDPPCYSGVSGRGKDCISADGVTLQAVTPPVTNGIHAHQAFTFALSPPVAPVTWPVTIAENAWHGTVFNMRRCFPPWAGVGARRLELEELLALSGV